MKIALSLYHGSPLNEGRTLLGSGKNKLPDIEPDGAFFLTDDHDYAVRFARGGSVTSYQVRLENAIDLRDITVCEQLQAVYDQLRTEAGFAPWDEMDGDIVDSAYMLLEYAPLVRWLKTHDYDGAIIAEDISLGVTSVAVFSCDSLTYLDSRVLKAPAASRDSPEP